MHKGLPRIYYGVCYIGILCGFIYDREETNLPNTQVYDMEETNLPNAQSKKCKHYT